ncbi:hypothetical protein FRC17_006062 [Serendipita sp. 399]|nr:hypothetical protein FRC17_006062 [Serendipita sp. 399]
MSNTCDCGTAKAIGTLNNGAGKLKEGVYHFVSDGKHLHGVGAGEAIKMLEVTGHPDNSYDWHVDVHGSLSPGNHRGAHAVPKDTSIILKNGDHHWHIALTEQDGTATVLIQTAEASGKYWVNTGEVMSIGSQDDASTFTIIPVVASPSASK